MALLHGPARERSKGNKEEAKETREKARRRKTQADEEVFGPQATEKPTKERSNRNKGERKTKKNAGR